MITQYERLSTAEKHRLANDSPALYHALRIEHLKATGASHDEIMSAADQRAAALDRKRKADEVAAAQRRADDDLVRRAEHDYASLTTAERHRLAQFDRPRFQKLHRLAMDRAGLPRAQFGR